MEQPSSSAAMSKTDISGVKSKPSSFGWANGEPVRYKDAKKALQRAHALASDVLNSDDDDIKALVASKRKTYEELRPKKKQKMKSLKNDSIGSLASSEITRSSATDEDIEWSDCDELELSRTISVLEQSINQGCQSSPISHIKKSSFTHSPTARSPSKKRIKSSPSKAKTLQTVDLNLMRDQCKNVDSSVDDGNDNELEWSDCDEAELSRNISLLEQY